MTNNWGWIPKNPIWFYFSNHWRSQSKNKDIIMQSWRSCTDLRYSQPWLATAPCLEVILYNRDATDDILMLPLHCNTKSIGFFKPPSAVNFQSKSSNSWSNNSLEQNIRIYVWSCFKHSYSFPTLTFNLS